MTAETIDLFACPFCGDALSLQSHPTPGRRGEDVTSGILSCVCCAYPIVDGIAYIRTGAQANAAMTHLGAGRMQDALFELLELQGSRRDMFVEALGQQPTFRTLLGILGGSDREYLLFRFSDPTFVCAESVATVLARDLGHSGTRVLDFGGGAGHLTRVLSREAPKSSVVVADVSFWELWLAKTIVARAAEPVCCDGNAPLPFRKGVFDLVISADAFHYVWSRRLLASELVRAAHPEGVIGLCHLHNADVFNLSAGMPLSARGYRQLFEDRCVRLFAEQALRDEMPSGRIDLAHETPEADLATASAFVLLASRNERSFRIHALDPTIPQTVGVNPLYERARDEGHILLRLRGTSEAYADEFGAFRDYLPAEVRLPVDWRGRIGNGDPDVLQLAQRRVLLDLPDRYV